MITVRLEVPGEPIPMPRARIVRLKNGRSHSFTPDEATRAKERVAIAARLARMPYFVGPLTVRVEAYLSEDRVTHWKRGSGDWDNYAKLACDALEGIAFGNDAAIIDGRGLKFPANGSQPRLVVFLTGNPGARPEPKPKKLTNNIRLSPAVYRR